MKTIKLFEFKNKYENNRIDFSFEDYDFIDGNDIIFDYMQEMFGAVLEERIDGWWYVINRVKCKGVNYELVWHEDVGNYAYCKPQTEKCINQLREDLTQVFAEINKKIEQVNLEGNGDEED